MGDGATPTSTAGLKKDLEEAHQKTIALYAVQHEYSSKSEQAKIGAQQKKRIIENSALR